MHKLTAKRQVTVPQSVCAALGLTPGDFVEIFERDGVAHIVKMSTVDISGQFSDLVKSKKIPSAKTLKQSLRTRAAKKFAK
ncbi:MAG: AbrB/MazE/SpoVT family DNA-binding domain-containing protein [Thiohalomonadales bacterium]